MKIQGLREDLRARHVNVPISRTRVCPDGDPYRPHTPDCTCGGSGLRAKPELTAEQIAAREAVGNPDPIPDGDPRGERDHFVESFDS